MCQHELQQLKSTTAKLNKWKQQLLDGQLQLQTTLMQKLEKEQKRAKAKLALEIAKIDLLYLNSTEMSRVFVTKLKSKFPEPGTDLQLTEWPSDIDLQRKPVKSLKQLRIVGVSWHQRIGAIFSLKFKLSDGSESPQFGK